jgi:hypothetical protein
MNNNLEPNLSRPFNHNVANSLIPLASNSKGSIALNPRDELIRKVKMKIFGSTTIPQKSHIPYRIIRHISEKCLKEFMQDSINRYKTNKQHFDTGENFSSVCLNTVTALSFLFLGEKVNKEFQHFLFKIVTFNLNLSWMKKGFPEIPTTALFDGASFYHSSKDPDYFNVSKITQDKIIASYMKEDLDKFVDFIKKQFEKNPKEEALETFKKGIRNYDFNKTFLEKFQYEMTENSLSVKENASFVYFVGMPYNIIRKNSSDSSFNFSFDHVFIIEQFFDTDTKDARYRLYQSWIGEATLNDDLKRRRNERGMSEAEMDIFLEKLQTFYSPNTTEDVAKRLMEECFGYNYSSEDTNLVTFDEKGLRGKALRYFSYGFNPEKVIDNLADFLIESPVRNSFFS